IGQEFSKNALVRFKKTLDSGLDNTPKSLVIGGPPGVGKTEMARALMAATGGNPDQLPIIECSKIKSIDDLAGLFGANEGYAGYKEVNTSSPLSPTRIRKAFGDRRPIVVLFDEVDKVGANVQKDFWDSLTSCMQDGKLRLKNGEVTDLSDAIFIFT